MASTDTFVNLGIPRCQKVLPLAYDDSLSYYESICKMTNKVNEIVDFIAEYEDTANALLEALNTTLPSYNTRIAKLETEFAGLDDIKASMTKLQSDFEELKTQQTSDVATLQAEIDAITTDIQTWDTKFAKVNTYIMTEIARVERDYNYKFYELRYDINVFKLELEAQMTAINKRIDYLIEHLSYDVYNPVQGKRITFDKNNQYVYEDLNGSCATCGEIAARRITVERIITGNWTVRLWATKSRELIARFFNHGYSTVSGVFTNWGNSISELVGIYFNSMTCSEIVEKNIPCSYFTDNSLTVTDVLKLKID